MGLFSGKASAAMASLFSKQAKPVEQAKPNKTSDKPNCKRRAETQPEPEAEPGSEAEESDSAESIAEDASASAGTSDRILGAEAVAKSHKKSSQKAKQNEDIDLEDRYFDKLAAQDATGPRRAKKAKIEQTESEKTASTVFFGNVPNVVITDKKAYRQFEALAAKFGTVVSIRFRSIAFSEQLPRRAAFVTQKLHASRDAVNAYVVYASPQEAETALALNGELFLEHHLRADSAARPAAHVPKRSVFLGNLDFELTEESLFRHFESVGKIEFVRIVRDKKTNVGRGFGYVQFYAAESVPLALQLDKSQLLGRELRVQAAKRIKASSAGDANKTAKAGRMGADGTRLSKAERRIAEKEARATKTGATKNGARAASSAVKPQILEGARAKEGEKISLGRKKPRHRGMRETRVKKFARAGNSTK